MRRRRKERFNSNLTDNDPMSSLGNLMDVMLVFACGLMVALILSWDAQSILTQNPFDQKNKVNLETGKEIKDSPLLEESGGSGYTEMGRVYQDPETGKLILIKE